MAVPSFFKKCQVAGCGIVACQHFPYAAIRFLLPDSVRIYLIK